MSTHTGVYISFHICVYTMLFSNKDFAGEKKDKGGLTRRQKGKQCLKEDSSNLKGTLSLLRCLCCMIKGSFTKFVNMRSMPEHEYG